MAFPLYPKYGSTVDYLYDNGEEAFADDVLTHNETGALTCQWKRPEPKE